MASDPELYRLGDLSDRGISSRRLRNLIASSTIIRVRPGVYADGATWCELTPERRIVTRARALDLVSGSRPVFAHETAAAVHGLGLFAPDQHRVHVIAPPERSGAAIHVVRHRGAHGDEVVDIDGLLCTTLTRTVADMARTAAFDQAVVVADAALRARCCSRDGRYDFDAAETLREAMLEIVARSAQGRGRAAHTLAFADGRAHLPGESISRIRLRSLGFRRLALQVPVRWPDGRDRYFVDFGFEDPGIIALGEFDGDGKYVDPQMSNGRSTREIVDAEKKREDWIRGRTQRRLARWNWTHLSSPVALGRRLAEFGIRPPR